MYQYLLGKVSTIKKLDDITELLEYQYLLGKVSTCLSSSRNRSGVTSYQYLLGKVSTRTFLPRLAEALIVTCN